MLKSFASICVIVTILIFYNMVTAENESDKGVYRVMHVEKCPGHESYAMQIDITKQKMNRTHDGYIGYIQLEQDLTDQHSIKCDIYKCVDGGCKHFYVLSENSFCAFCEKYAKKNLERMLAPYDRKLPLCPILAGKHELNGPYMFDLGELPEDGIPGIYEVYAYLLAGGVELGCLKLTMEFMEKQEE